MVLNRSWFHAVAVLVAVTALTACGDDPVGPQLGDLAFTPAGATDIGLERQMTTTLSNVGSAALGPILVGGSPAIGLPPLDEAVQCPVLSTITPGRISSLSPGATVDIDITVDDSNVDIQLCPAGEYEIEFVASASGVSLAAMTLIIERI